MYLGLLKYTKYIFKNNCSIYLQDDGRSYQNENSMLTANTSFNQFMEQVNIIISLTL